MRPLIDDVADRLHVLVGSGADLEMVIEALLHNGVRDLDVLAAVLLYCNDRAAASGDGWVDTADKVRGAIRSGLFNNRQYG